MRILIAAGALLALLSAPAAAFPFFGRTYNEKWCLGYNEALSGLLDCSYYTWRQCEATLSGVGGFCVRNADWSMAERTWHPRRRRHWR